MLSLLVLCGAITHNSPSFHNPFGIGVYTDTPGSPELPLQLNYSRELVGAGGWVVLYLCAWKTPNSSCMNRSTSHDAESNRALLQAYSRGLRVVARIGNPYFVRDHSDNVSPNQTEARTNYTSLAAAYARLLSSLPPPPDGSPLYVHVGNEFSACNEWRCSGSLNEYMSHDLRALEVASFYRDVSSALQPLRLHGSQTWDPHQLQLAHGPIANWFMSSCQCGSGDKLGVGNVGLRFLESMLSASPDLYSDARVDFLASHSYPFSAAPWGTGKASRGLAYYRNETTLVGRKDLPVAITETGWRDDKAAGPSGEGDRANWTALAYEKIWLPDPQVLAVCPFLLAGRFWKALGWPWLDQSETGQIARLPVFLAVKDLRAKVTANSNPQVQYSRDQHD